MRGGDLLSVRRADVGSFGLALGVALAAGAVAAHQPALAAAGILAGTLALLAAILGPRAFPWFLVLFAVVPFYSSSDGFLVPPHVPAEAIALLAGLVLGAPWAWALLQERELLARWRAAELVLAGAIGVLLLVSLTALGKTVLDPVPAGLLVGSTAFFAGQRFSELRHWGPAATVGVTVLLLIGGIVYASNPGHRVGFFTGYPILYAGLIVALLPAAIAWSWRRIRVLAVPLVAASAIMLVLSETRSAWIAVAAMLLVWSIFIVKFRRWRTLGLLLVGVLLVAGMVATSGTLSDVVRTRVAAEELTSEAVTHRQSIYGYAYEQLLADPVLGLGYPGASKEELSGRTGIDAADNGFLAAAADLGAVGLAVALTPLLALLFALARLWSRRSRADLDLALALGLLGLLVVTIFFDTFYWPQSSLLIFAFAGMLSVRLRPGAGQGPAASAAG